MDWIFSKLGEVRKGGLEAFFLLVSSFCFVDWFSIAIWKINMAEKFSKLTLIEITYLIIAYFCVFYFLKLSRFLITTLIVSRFTNRAKDKDYYRSKEDYYYLDDLLKDSMSENNEVKYKNYLRLKTLNETRNNLKTFVFVTVVMIIIDSAKSGTIIRTLSEYKVFSTVLILFGFGLLVWGLQSDSDDDTNTFIRNEEFKIEK